MSHLECGKCGYSCGTEAAWERHLARTGGVGCYKLSAEEIMTPEEKLAARYSITMPQMRDMREAFDVFGLYGTPGPRELQLVTTVICVISSESCSSAARGVEV